MDNLLQEAVHETVPGILVDDLEDAKSTLLIGESMPSNGKPHTSGILTIRFFIPLLYEPHLALNPGYVLAERGGELFGWQAWDFCFKRFELHPRADITGLRSDGIEDTLFLKTLDIAAPIRVFAYASPSAVTPLRHVGKLKILDSQIEVPERLMQYIPLAES